MLCYKWMTLSASGAIRIPFNTSESHCVRESETRSFDNLFMANLTSLLGNKHFPKISALWFDSTFDNRRSIPVCEFLSAVSLCVGSYTVVQFGQRYWTGMTYCNIHLLISYYKCPINSNLTCLIINPGFKNEKKLSRKTGTEVFTKVKFNMFRNLH